VDSWLLSCCVLSDSASSTPRMDSPRPLAAEGFVAAGCEIVALWMLAMAV
jgi:hypothetical protein